MREKKPKTRRFSKTAIILTVCISFAVALLVFFGVVLYYNGDVSFDYASVEPSMQTHEKANGSVSFSASLPANIGIHHTHSVVALDHDADIAYIQYTVFVSARRKNAEFGEYAQKTFYSHPEDSSAGTTVGVTDENGNTVQYRTVVCEIRYALFRAGGMAGIDFLEEPVTLWSIPLPDRAVAPKP